MERSQKGKVPPTHPRDLKYTWGSPPQNVPPAQHPPAHSPYFPDALE